LTACGAAPGNGVVHEDIDTTIGFQRTLHEISHLRSPGYVRSYAERSPAFLPDAGDDGLYSLGIAAIDDHRSAFVSHTLGDRLSDALSGPGDNRDFAGEVEGPQNCSREWVNE